MDKKKSKYEISWASSALTIIGIASFALGLYIVISRDVTALILIPALIATFTGITNLRVKIAPRG